MVVILLLIRNGVLDYPSNGPGRRGRERRAFVTNGYYWLLTVTNGYSGLLGASPARSKMAERRVIGGHFFGNHPLTSGKGRSGLGRGLQFSAARLQQIPLYNRE